MVGTSYRHLKKGQCQDDIRVKKCFFIADLYGPEKKLVIEPDGKIHEYQQDYDYQRDIILKEFGLTTLRIENKELNKIEQRILEHLE